LVCILSDAIQSISHDIDWPLALKFLKAKNTQITEIVVKLFELVLEEDESGETNSDITLFQENLWTVWTQWTARLAGMAHVSTSTCIVLYCIVLQCIVLYCIALYCITLYSIVLYCKCIVLYCIAMYCIV
jgi:hypothetical protein